MLLSLPFYGKCYGDLHFGMLISMIPQVVPMENLNGRRLVEAGDLCERRNGHALEYFFIQDLVEHLGWH